MDTLVVEVGVDDPLVGGVVSDGKSIAPAFGVPPLRVSAGDSGQGGSKPDRDVDGEHARLGGGLYT